MECKRRGCSNERVGPRWCKACDEQLARIRRELEAEEKGMFNRAMRAPLRRAKANF